MDLGKILGKAGVATVVNFLAGAKVLGWGALFHSEDTGYLDPNGIDGYTYNPDDGNWYLTPPAPDLGQYAWENRADTDKSAELNILREVRIQHNESPRVWAR